MRVGTAILDLLFPPACWGCDAKVDSQDRLCATCLGRVPVAAPPWCSVCGLPFLGVGDSHRCSVCLASAPQYRQARACALYRGDQPDEPLPRCLHGFKYHRRAALYRPLAELVVDRCPLDLSDYDLAVPVPLHLERLRWRGFNQALLLLRPLARRAGLRVDCTALERSRSTQPQVSLAAAERRTNVRHAFSVGEAGAIQGARILLFDDVLTTGATVDECARVLRRSGAEVVDVLVLARALLQGR